MSSRSSDASVPELLIPRRRFTTLGSALLGAVSGAGACRSGAAVATPATPPTDADAHRSPPTSSGASDATTVDDYCVAHTTDESEHVRRIAQRTRAETDAAVMMVGPLVGTLLRHFVRLTAAKRVLEIGTFTGYSALSMAEGMQPGGKIITLDISERWTAIAKEEWAKSPHGDKIELRLAPAAETLPTLKGPFDLVFIDADKESQTGYWDAVLPKVRQGGLIVVDNVLFRQRVLDPQQESARAVAAFNDHVIADERVQTVMLPVRDGITVAYKL